MPAFTPRSINSPTFETPSPNMMSNSTCLNGGATLFFTTLTRTWLPVASSRSLLVETGRVAAGRGLGTAVHHPDLHADLVDEDHHAIRARDRGGELAQRLAHQPGLK